jgi:gamma-glutamyltranspeptidase/glutathione hydrolase
MTLPQALHEKRFHDQLFPATTFFEEGFDKHVVKDMMSRGHNASWISGRVSAVQATRRLWNGTFEAAGEPRQFNSGGLSC